MSKRGGERERQRERKEKVGVRRGVVHVPISPLSSQSSPARGPKGSV